MTMESRDGETPVHQRMEEEERIQHSEDTEGNRWTKAYFGGGAHFRNWLSQIVEIKGERNVRVEEVDSSGFQCYEQGGEKLYRVWVREKVESGDEAG
jgi:hypothetical protein